MATWKFKPLAEDDTRENPTQSQFFTTDEVRTIANGLVREGIQNALDEHLDKTQPVEIKITLSNSQNALNPSQYNFYLQELIEHLQSTESGLRELPDFSSEKMDYLIFEDFNTKGLRGNPFESKDCEIEDKTKPHNFYFFWRNIGITGKPEDKLGRWGIGKTVFPASSRINTFWGYTIQSDTKKDFFLGQSILRKHNLESNPQDWGYKPYGYYGTYLPDSFFARPIEDKVFIKDFKNTFQLKRADQSGLSVIIPFYKKEIKKDHLLFSIIEQYFYPILNNKLRVEIYINDETILITQDTIYEIIHIINNNDDDAPVFNKEALVALFDFTKWIIGLQDNNYISLNAPNVNNQPNWNEALWNGLEADELIKKFETDGRIAFKIPIKYHNKIEKYTHPKICWFKAYLERDEKLDKPEDHFIRENITIIDVKSLESPKVRGVVVIDDKDLSNLLGDSENPAHTQWQKDSQNFTYKYVHGDKCIQFVIRSLQRLYNRLQKPAEGLDRDILKNLFYTEDENIDKLPIKPDDDSGKDTTGDTVIIDTPINSSYIKIQKIPGGITIYSANNESFKPKHVEIKLAYMTTRGKPLNKYQQYDFELNKVPIQIEQRECQIIYCKKNIIAFDVDIPSFEMTIKGFDLKRDLFIKVDTKLLVDDTEI